MNLGSKAKVLGIRDAVHVAMISVMASTELKPGQHVGVDKTGKYSTLENPIGIVDPFLTNNVKQHDGFYLCLYPNTVKGMVHHWLHPSFPDNLGMDKSASIDFLMDVARSLHIEYDYMISEDWPIAKGELVCDNGRCEVWEDIADEFWKHYEIVTGRVIKDQGTYTCFC